MAQFNFSAESDVAGQEPEHGWFRRGLQIMNEFPHARAYFPPVLRQHVGQPIGITIKEEIEIALGGFDAVFAE